ncbi:MAG: hypothetical protein D6701_12230, partial [Gemmatimonadetes bacterium]
MTTFSALVRRLGTLALTSVLVWAAGASAPASAQTVRAEHLAALRARSIGPAGMSGRVAAVAVDPSDGRRVFVGAATGGVWRSLDGGLTWQPVFDDQPVLGVGAVAVSPANAAVVWVGTGEANPRNSAGVGAGVYRSRDGGETWELTGLERSERIARVLPHPRDADVAYVAALGPAWSDGEERGVYRTRDGGRTWEQVLVGGPRTGAADLVMDPSNPDHLLAAMWEYRREPWFFTSGGPGSGLYRSLDGGDSWTRLGPQQGLPEGELGRIGLAFAPSDPRIAYALVEAERSVLLRSEDGGEHWRLVSDEPGIAPRPFYYADLRVDPQNENRLYSLHSVLQVSEDQGRTWRTVVPSQVVHGDVHELWIDPADGRRMIIGNDGGIAFTYDRGAHWRFVENLPLAQYYHISVDDAVPFNIYGGLQDNGSWYGPMTVWESRGILNAHWRRTGGGDGFASFVDPTDPRYGYSMSQQGRLQRFDKVTGRRVPIQPVHPDGVPLRFNWNAALNVDPFDPAVLYLGSQFVHRTRDRGASWEIISPDLTTNDPAKQRQDESGGLTLDATGAENHTTILTIAPSPLERGAIWVGTDDGNVQLTRDDGASWTNVADRIPDIAAGGWVAHIEPSRAAAGRAWVVFDDHRRGDWTTWVFRTDDWGRSWERVRTEGVRGFAHVIREDPDDDRVLYLGTEFGLWISLDAGRQWLPFRHGLPAVPVRDLRVHPRDGDLVVGTHGRGLYVIDDIRALRGLAGPAPERAAALFEPAPAIRYVVAEAIGYRSTGHTMQMGELRPRGALLTYWLDPDVEGPVRLEVADGEGRTVARLTGPGGEGLHRVVWDLRESGGPDRGRGLEVPAGRYRVSLRADGGLRDERTLDVLDDPREPIDADAARARIAFLREAAEVERALGAADARLRAWERAAR